MPFRLELRTGSVERLHGADYQVTVWLERPFHPPEQGDSVLLIEIDRHIAAEDHIEAPERRKVRHQVQLLKGRHGADLVADPPSVRDRFVVTRPLRLTQSARNFDGRENTPAGPS